MSGRKKPSPAQRLLFIAAAVLLLALYGWYDEVHGPARTAAATVLPADTGAGLTAVFIDVGQGDCVLVGDGDDWVLVDAGPPEAADAVVEALRLRGVEKLSMVVGTHPHSDHIGGLAEVLEAFPVDDFYMPRVTYDTPVFESLMAAAEAQNEDILTPHPGQSVEYAHMRITFLHPETAGYADVNDDSIVIRVDGDYGSLLLTGDITAGVERELLESGALLEADVLKVAHHGSDTSSTEAFLEAVDPQTAVIQCGADNSYGHPSSEVLDRLEALNADILRTDRDGTVTVTLTAGGVGAVAGR